MIPPTIRVVYADDHPVTRDGIEKALNSAARVKIAGVAEDFDEVLRLLPTAHADVVVLDIIGMRGSPIAMVERITREYPGTHVIMFSSSVAMVPGMLHAGAKAYIVKDEVTDYLVEAIYAVCAGETFLSPLAKEYMDNYTTQAAHLHLTQRERDVLIPIPFK